ncbi:MAG: hypothetical protein IPK83_00365 [Planctomycetes bacterium]|nr:hypothetical protein [Planctomycetota bacterium]
MTHDAPSFNNESALDSRSNASYFSPVPTRLKHCLYGVVLIGAGIVAYWNSFDVPFLFDDQNAIEDNTFIRALWPLDRAMSAPPQSTGAGRPILNLSLAVNYHFGGLWVWGYHAVNLGIHIAVGLLLMGLIRRTLALPALRDRFVGASNELAFSATLIWLVHPLQTESVTYIVQRAESLAALFYVATLYAFLRGATGGHRAWFALHSRHVPRAWQQRRPWLRRAHGAALRSFFCKWPSSMCDSAAQVLLCRPGSNLACPGIHYVHRASLPVGRIP